MLDLQKIKSGWKTTEFWFSVLTTIGSVGTAVAGFIPASYAAIVASGTAMAYALSRGLAKREPSRE